MSRKPRRFAFLAFSGLADLAIEELTRRCSARRPAVLKLPNYDCIIADVDRERTRDIARLRIPEDQFLMLGGPVRIEDQRDLTRISKLIDPPEIFEGLSLKNTLFGGQPAERPRYNCFVKQDEDRDVYRKDIAARVNLVVGGIFRRWRIADPAQIEFWGFYIESMLHLGLRLTDNRHRYRGAAPALRPGALRPTIAAALVHVAAPREGELIIDPMCGTGSILREATAYGAARVAGGDMDGRAVAIARASLESAAVSVEKWDSRRLPNPDASIDAIVCNMPFGKKYSTHGGNRVLYPALLKEWLRVLKPSGRMALLTSDARAMEENLRQLPVAWSMRCRVNVLGERAGIYHVKRKAG